jgi:hypothetical protein
VVSPDAEIVEVDFGAIRLSGLIRVDIDDEDLVSDVCTTFASCPLLCSHTLLSPQTLLLSYWSPSPHFFGG